jgi:hypothetical protein
MQTMKYTPRPLRESNPHKSTAEIQAEIDLMRALYMQEGSNNHRIITPEQIIGGSLLAGAIALLLFVL